MGDETTMRKAVIASIVAAVLVIVFIQPILSLSWKFLLLTTQKFTDGVYASAALGERNVEVFQIYTEMRLLWFFLFLLNFMIACFLKAKEKPESAQKGGEFRFLKPFKTFFSSPLTAGLLLLMFCIPSLMNVTGGFMNLQLNVSFRQRMTVLVPHISEQEHKEFLASWAAMQSRQDYENIIRRMNNAAKIHNVTLPKPLPGTGTTNE